MKNKKTNDNNNIQKALAMLIINTKTLKRTLSLVEIAEWLEVAIKSLGSINAVAERISISAKMLQQFLTIKNLTKEVYELFKQRRIDSVDIAVHLCKLNNFEQIIVAQKVAEGELNSEDVRAVIDIKKQCPKQKIEILIEKVKKSKNIKHYIIEFVVREKVNIEKKLRRIFAKYFGKENIVNLKINGNIGYLTINYQGKKKLMALAKTKNITKSEVVNLIMQGDLS